MRRNLIKIKIITVNSHLGSKHFLLVLCNYLEIFKLKIRIPFDKEDPKEYKSYLIIVILL